jgi:hypothetical protein
MDTETLRDELLKHARNAFETACTLRDSQRIEVYLNKGFPTTSDILEESEEIIYGPDRVLCYQVYGHDYLEGEIKVWIDYARVIPQPTDEMPLPEPTAMEKSIREMVDEIAKRNGVEKDAVSSFEVFANMPMDLLGTIEQQIIEYWWSANEEENGKKLALAQIEEALLQSA